MAIGTGSAAVAATRSGLITEAHRNAFTGSIDFTTLNKLTFITDFTSIEASGTNNITELGVFTLSSGGQAWHVEGFAGVNFDGTQELQTEITWRLY